MVEGMINWIDIQVLELKIGVESKIVFSWKP